MTYVIHAVPWGSGDLTAECGQILNGAANGHTGHYRPLQAYDGNRLCPTCAGDEDAGDKDAGPATVDPAVLAEVTDLIAQGHPCSAISVGAQVTVICTNIASAARWQERTPNGLLPVSRVPIAVVLLTDDYAAVAS